MGKIIMFVVILFAAYWGRKYYKKTNEVVEVKNEPQDIDELINYYNQKINEIESKSIGEIEKQEVLLAYYKEQLNKINKIKTNKK